MRGRQESTTTAGLGHPEFEAQLSEHPARHRKRQV